MKWLIWSIRTWFCKHEWDHEEQEINYHNGDPQEIVAIRIRVSATCKHCGWHRKYNKF